MGPHQVRRVPLAGGPRAGWRGFRNWEGLAAAMGSSESTCTRRPCWLLFLFLFPALVMLLLLRIRIAMVKRRWNAAVFAATGWAIPFVCMLQLEDCSGLVITLDLTPAHRPAPLHCIGNFAASAGVAG